MNIPSTSPAAAPTSPAAAGAPAVPSVAEREVKLTTWLIVMALLLGAVVQVWIPPGGVTLVAGAFLASLVVLAVSFFAPGRMRETIAGFRFISTLLFVLAVFAVLGTLVLQGKPPFVYVDRYGMIGKLIVALRIDDVFHGLPFALVMALFGAAVMASATLRWPVKLKAAGFFVCHVGLMTSLAGAAASATLSIRGRIDLHAGGEQATQVRVTRAGMPTGEVANLGFDLHLDRFDLVNYETEYRVGYYAQVTIADARGERTEWRLKASFDPDLEKHRLPNGDSFRVKAVYPDFAEKATPTGIEYATASQAWKNPAVVAELHQLGLPKEQLLVASRSAALFVSPTSALVFERRDKEVKAFVSHVTARQGSASEKRSIAVNDPFTFAGWTLYQVNYDPKDPTYSGLEAVYDPGVAWVFTGFALISLGVFWMFYVEPRLKRRTAAAAKA